MGPSERPTIWSTDDVARRRQEVLCTLIDDNHPLYVDARELFTPPLSREEVTQLLLTALETYCEIRAVARELRYLDPIVKNDTKGRQKRHPHLHVARKHLLARLEFLGSSPSEWCFFLSLKQAVLRQLREPRAMDFYVWCTLKQYWLAKITATLTPSPEI